MLYDVIVVGAGASGLVAAIHSADNKKVLLVEANAKIGKKLLATGNGKCNLSNKNIDISHYYGDNSQTKGILQNFPCEKICDFFEEIGIKTFADVQGRVYPKSEQALTVVKTLSDICSEKNVDCKLNFEVEDIKKEDGIFTLYSSNGEYICGKKVILSVGGKASPKLSGSLKGYDLAQKLGHSVTDLYPVLTGFTSDEKYLKALSGVRAKCTASLVKNNQILKSEKGEVIFGKNSVSGICVFNLSIIGAKELVNKGKFSLDLDLCDITHDEIVNYITKLIKIRPFMKSGDLLNGLVNMKLGYEIIKMCKIDNLLEAERLKESQIENIAFKLKHFRVSVKGLKSYEDAQLTSGGVPLKEVDTITMQSKICPNLYITGEVLNIHGDCGGYNLHFAWATGIIAGKSASEKVIFK
ncbi:MAG: aminoacetone oxidase family FAD-binding enzyme [Clostridia bacterium]